MHYVLQYTSLNGNAVIAIMVTRGIYEENSVVMGVRTHGATELPSPGKFT